MSRHCYLIPEALKTGSANILLQRNKPDVIQRDGRYFWNIRRRHRIFELVALNSCMQMIAKLRPANETDHDAIASLWHGSASLPGVGPPVMPTEAELRKRIDLELAAGWEVTVAVRNDEIVGFLAIRRRQAVLAELFVRPGSLGAGVGRMLLGHAIAQMPEGFSLYTRTANERARRFYDKAGLVELHHGTHPRSGDPIVYYGWNAAEKNG